MSEVTDKVSADQAIELAFEYFERYVSRGQTFSQVLLEELEPSSTGGWIVAIGFSGGRFKETTKGSQVSLFAEKLKEELRDVRHFYISSDGSFEKMN